ncbi:MAG TPA: hypothetical protein VG798_02655 [Rhizomicrobium sp.]|nr:hypothetical protein [Rhizomicrobium sp.]
MARERDIGADDPGSWIERFRDGRAITSAQETRLPLVGDTASLVAANQAGSVPYNGGAGGSLSDEVNFISGLDPDGTLALYSYWAWNSDSPAAYTGGYTLSRKWAADSSATVAGTPGGTVNYYFDPSSNWSAAEQQVFIDGLSLWSADANISFAQTTDPASAQIVIKRNGSTSAGTSAAIYRRRQCGPDRRHRTAPDDQPPFRSTPIMAAASARSPAIPTAPSAIPG